VGVGRHSRAYKIANGRVIRVTPASSKGDEEYGLKVHRRLLKKLRAYTPAVPTIHSVYKCNVLPGCGKKYPRESSRVQVVEMEDAGVAIGRFPIATVELARNLSAQLLVFLAALQEKAQTVHYDLHASNVCVKRSPSNATHFVMGYRGQALYIPNMGYEIRVIDYDLAHSDEMPGSKEYPNYGVVREFKPYYNQVFIAHALMYHYRKNKEMYRFLLNALAMGEPSNNKLLRPIHTIRSRLVTPEAALLSKHFDKYRVKPTGPGVRLQRFTLMMKKNV
jgi:hypothetical protein